MYSRRTVIIGAILGHFSPCFWIRYDISFATEYNIISTLLFDLGWNIKQTELTPQRNKWQRCRFHQDKAVLTAKPAVVRLSHNLLHCGITNDAALFIVFQSLWHDGGHRCTALTLRIWEEECLPLVDEECFVSLFPCMNK